MTEIIRDLHNGNPKGEGYTIKEILTAHIREDSKNHDIIITELRMIRQTYLTQKMGYLAFLLLLTLLGSLAGYVFYG